MTEYFPPKSGRNNEIVIRQGLIVQWKALIRPLALSERGGCMNGGGSNFMASLYTTRLKNRE